jgi:hypothetical protein
MKRWYRHRRLRQALTAWFLAVFALAGVAPIRAQQLHDVRADTIATRACHGTMASAPTDANHSGAAPSHGATSNAGEPASSCFAHCLATAVPVQSIPVHRDSGTLPSDMTAAHGEGRSPTPLDRPPIART